MLDIAGELRELGIKFEEKPGHIAAICPFHDDTRPSLDIEPKENRFNCRVPTCGARGDLTLLLAKLRNWSLTQTRKYVSQKYAISFAKTIDPRLIEDYHQAIWSNEKLLAELAKRAITKEQISEFRIGVFDGRITIPIFNENNHVVNIRYYLPNAEENKVFSQLKHGENTIYPFSQLKYDKLVIAGGEIKAIAGTVLNQFGIGCVSGTTGEGNYDTKWVEKFKNKILYVLFDIDEPGRKAAAKFCHYFSPFCKAIYNVLLPLNPEKWPKGGLDDYLFENNAKTLQELLSSVTVYNPAKDKDDSIPVETTLTRIFDAKHVGRRVKFTGVLATVFESSYNVPKTIHIDCDREQECCSLCKLVYPNKESNFLITPEEIGILSLVNSSNSQHAHIVEAALEIPRVCKIWKHSVVDYYSIEKVRISPQLAISNLNTEKSMQPAVIVKDGERDIEMGGTYEFVGKVWPDPRNQSSTVVVSEYEAKQDALSSYVCEEPEKLFIFQPTEWTVEGITDKLDQIYADFEYNVTRIQQRRDVHIAFDLTYHSALFFQFKRQQEHGWVNTFIIGDSSNGKSKTGEKLMQHYRLGEKIEAKNATRSGVLGGTSEINNEYVVSWGIMCAQDKRLVFFDEAEKIAEKDLIGQIRDARSSGIAQITHIKQRKTFCRTRLVFVSNPNNGRNMASYNYGLEAARDVIGAPQDIRRFDLIISTHTDEVNINSLGDPPEVAHKFTSDLCHELLLWAWTRNTVTFEDENFVVSESIKLTERYSEEFPLVDKGSMRLKLARLATALAARTYSVDDNGSIFVRNCHVQWIVNFLERMYSKSSFGYLDYSNAIKESETLRNEEHLFKLIGSLDFPRDSVKGILSTNTIDLTAIMDACGVDRDKAQDMLSMFLRCKALKRVGKQCYKTAAFTTKLKYWAGNGLPEDKPIPNYERL